MKKTKKELKNSRQPFEALVAAKEVIKKRKRFARNQEAKSKLARFEITGKT
jgi:hypothetical protein